MLKPLFPTRPWLWLGRLILVALLLGAAATGVFVGGLLAVIDEAPPLEEFEDFSPALITRVLDGEGSEVVAEFFVERREYLPLPTDRFDPETGEVAPPERQEIPWRLVEAFIAIEDERFFEHSGVDPQGILAAVYSRLVRGGRLRGASTLTQQLARKTLEEITDERLMDRKIREAIVALQIERRFSKETILEYYLNQIPLGNGIYGVQAAAINYFGVPAKELTLPQMATIAGIPPLPERYNPRDALENARRGLRVYDFGPDDATVRRNLVLGNMRTLGFITSSEYERARQEPMMLGAPPARTDRAPYFIDLIRRQILAEEDLGRAALFERGVVIHSTIDPALQELAQSTLREGLVDVEALWQERKIERLWEEEEPDNMGWRVDPGERRLVRIAAVHETGLTLELNGYVGDAPLPAHRPYFRPEVVLRPGNLIDVEILETTDSARTFRARLLDETHVQGAIVVLDTHSGDVLAMVGGTDWDDELSDGQWNRAILGGRQPGSSFKPFVFAAALEEGGLTPASFFIDERVEYPLPNGEVYVPRNFENVHFGPTTVLEALEHSRNVVTILMTEHLGPRRVRDFTLRFDFTRDRARWTIDPYINLGLGVNSVTPLELATGYATFVHDGVIRRPRVWTHITDRDGRILHENRQPERRILSRETARQVLRMMQQVIASGSGERTIGRFMLGEDGIPALAGKTGTTTSNIDAWFGGMTPDMVVVVFVGFDNNISLGPRMTGSEVAGPMWRRFVERAVEIRPPTQMTFDTPPSLVLCDICSQTGLLWGENCERAREVDPVEVVRYEDVPFVPGTEPTRECPFSHPYRNVLELAREDRHVFGRNATGHAREAGRASAQPLPTAPGDSGRWRMIPSDDPPANLPPVVESP